MLERTVRWLRGERGLYPRSALAVVIAGLVIAIAYSRLIAPTSLTIAAPPPDSAEAALVDGLANLLQNGSRGVRLVVRRETNLAEAARKLESGDADLAIVRPDVWLPANGLTVAILRQEAIIILHSHAQKLEGLSSLRGKTLGVISRSGDDEQAVRALLEFNDLAQSIRIQRVSEADAAAAMSEGKASAIAFLATPGSSEARRIGRALAQGLSKPPAMMKLAQSEVISAFNPTFSAIKIPPGGVYSEPLVPAEEIDGVSVSWRLMARSGIDRGPISILTERLFESRSLLARASPVALTMKAPDAEGATSAVLPNHRGALDYFNREQLTFMDRYGDWLWFGLFAATGVSSAFAWIGRMFTRRRREVIDEALNRLCRILAEARNAETLERLSEISLEVDRLVAISVWRARRRSTNTQTISSLMLAIDAARESVRARRDELVRFGATLNPVSRVTPSSGRTDSPASE